MKEFSAAKGWILDFDAINQKRYAALPATHPLRLIQPYINIDLMPFDYDGIESELSASWNVQDWSESQPCIRAMLYWWVVHILSINIYLLKHIHLELEHYMWHALKDVVAQGENATRNDKRTI